MATSTTTQIPTTVFSSYIITNKTLDHYLNITTLHLLKSALFNYSNSSQLTAGDFAEKFVINQANEVKLQKSLEQRETSLWLKIIRINKDKPGETVNAIQFKLTFQDCTQVDISWQTIFVAVLSSLCVILMSSLAIMLILYKQRNDPSKETVDDNDSRNDESTKRPQQDETFINPRRTSSYDYNTLNRASMSAVDMRDIPEE